MNKNYGNQDVLENYNNGRKFISDNVLKNELSQLKQPNNFILIQDKSNLTYIESNQIIFCQSYGHKCFIHTSTDTITTNKYKLSDLKQIIDSPNFSLINQSYLINWKYVIKIENKHAVLINNTRILISKRRLKESLLAYRNYLLNNL